MLSQIIDATRLTPQFCADVLRVPVEQFHRWMDGSEPLPAFVTPELSALLGVPEDELRSRKAARGMDSGAAAPAIWYKLRDERLRSSDREMVGLVRRLGFFMKQLDQVQGTRSSSAWHAAADEVISQTDLSASPIHQGIEAAVVFRSIMNFDHGHGGVGEMLRPQVRRKGLILIESPIPKSDLEGCCFEVGTGPDKRACVFANSFKSTWFRRNEIILHELCHAIFDIHRDPVALDFSEIEGACVPAIAEVRARAFMRECLAPAAVLEHYANQFGIDWKRLTAGHLASLVARIHVEKGTILESAYENGLITAAQRSEYASYDCSALLREITQHALSTSEYLRSIGEETPIWAAENRATTTSRRLRLPAGYVDRVISAANSGEISRGKAAEMLLMDRYTFQERFGSNLTEPH